MSPLICQGSLRAPIFFKACAFPAEGGCSLAARCGSSHQDPGDGLSPRPETEEPLLSNLCRNGAALWGTREGASVNLFPGRVFPTLLTQGAGAVPLLKCPLRGSSVGSRVRRRFPCEADHWQLSLFTGRGLLAPWDGHRGTCGFQTVSFTGCSCSGQGLRGHRSSHSLFP